MRLRWISVVLIAACSASSAAPESEVDERTNGDEAETSASPFGLANGAHPSDGLYTAGQPSAASIEAAYAGGVRTVISLRAEGEPGQAEALAAVERLGMRFERLPVEGAEGVTAENARTLELLLAEASNHGETLVHCGSSNRVGALIALRAFFVFDSELDDAIAQGRAAGLAGLEGRVREVLQQVCADAPDDARCPRESHP